MKKRIELNNVVAALVLLFWVAGTLTAETEIFPTNPTEFDFIGITVSGEWHNSCVPNVSFVSVMGDSIHFVVFDDYPPDIVCLQVISGWELTDYVGPLSPGTYTIHAYHMFDPCSPFSDPYTFVVSGDPQVFAPGDFDEDGLVDCDDIRTLARAWLSESGDDNWNPDCDISDPNDEVIDGRDFGVFAVYWDGCGDPPPPAPGMSYNIEACDPGAKSAAGDKGALRFSATVDDNYVLFEDMMVANCCAMEVWLEMMVEDDVITLYELEYTPIPCTCICDWPVTATLGPFETGTYTLQVYEDWGGFIGNTIVTIE